MVKSQNNSELIGSPKTQGILYYAIGKNWIQEALQSVQSVKAVMPDIKTAIVSDRALPQELFNIQIKAPCDVGVKQLKMWTLGQTPFEKTLYLDTDTYVTDSLWEIFEMLNQFEIALAITPYWKIDLCKNGGKLKDKEVPVCFPKFNTGVIAFQKNSKINCFFSNWAELHKVWGEGQDQAPFRNVLYHSDIRFGVLSPAYNYRLPYPNGIWGSVKIFHSHDPNLPSLSETINRSESWRITSPLKFKNSTIFYGQHEFKIKIKQKINRLRNMIKDR